MIALLDNLSDRKIIYGKGGKFCDKLRLCCSIHSCIFTGGRSKLFLKMSPIYLLVVVLETYFPSKTTSVPSPSRRYS